MKQKPITETVIEPEVVLLRRNLATGNPRIVPSMSDSLIAELLLKRFSTVAVVEGNGKWLGKALGSSRFNQILALAKEMPSLKSELEPKTESAQTTVQSDNPKTSRKTLESVIYSVGRGVYITERRGRRIIHVKAMIKGVPVENDIELFNNYTPENKRTIPCSYYDGKLHLDECVIYKTEALFQVGKEYRFVVTAIPRIEGKIFIYYLIDEYGNSQATSSPVQAEVGDSVTCTVSGFRKKFKHIHSLILTDLKDPVSPIVDNSRLVIDEDNDPSPVIRSGKISELHRKYADHDYHLFCNSFTCCCCGRDFGTRQGYRMDLTKDVICKECMALIFGKRGSDGSKGWIQILYTNMGHKR